MRKYFIFAAIILSALTISCKKFDTNNSSSYTFKSVSNIDVAGTFAIAMSSGEKLISVQLTPSDASPGKDIMVTCEQPDEAVIAYSQYDYGILVTPKSIGTAKLILTAVSGTAEPKECKVIVTETPIDPKTITILKSDSQFIGGNLCLVKDESYQLKAEVKNTQSQTTEDFNVIWSVESGGSNVDLAPDGTVTAKVESGSAVIKATVDGYPSISGTVTVNIMPAPTDISLSSTNPALNPDGELIIKKGAEVSVSTSVSPAGAIGVIEVSSSNPAFASVSISGNSVKIKGESSSQDPVTITVTSPYNSSISKTITVYVFDYGADDSKPGDYVYSNGSLFQKKDGGFRHKTWSGELIYQAADGRRSSTPKNFPGNVLGGTGTYKFIGVVASPYVPSDEDFMGCGYLANCKDKELAVNLYEYRSFRQSNLPGLDGSHVLVLSWEESEATHWSEEIENIARTTDKTNNIYQSQLYNGDKALYFSQEELDYWEDYVHSMWPSYVLDFRYYQCGFVAYLDMLFYSKHVRNSDFQVIPVMKIDAFINVPKISSWAGGTAKSTTGWFLPGYLEWMYISMFQPVIKNALGASGASSLEGKYWSTEEESTSTVFCYEVTGNSVTRLGGDGKEIRKATDNAKTRAVLYL